MRGATARSLFQDKKLFGVGLAHVGFRRQQLEVDERSRERIERSLLEAAGT